MRSAIDDYLDFCEETGRVPSLPYTGGGRKMMEERDNKFLRSLYELVQKGRAKALCRLVARRFGEETAGTVSEVLHGLVGPATIDEVIDAFFECETGEELIERVPTVQEDREEPGLHLWGWRECLEAEKEGRAKTMAEVVERFQRCIDERVRAGETEVLHRLAARRFGEASAMKLSGLLDNPDEIDEVADALIDCDTARQFIERVWPF